MGLRNFRKETAVKDNAENIIEITLLCNQYGVHEVVSLILCKRNIKLSKLTNPMNDILDELRKMNTIYFLSNANISRNFNCDDGVHLIYQKSTHILVSNFLLLLIAFLILIDYIVNPV